MGLLGVREILRSYGRKHIQKTSPMRERLPAPWVSADMLSVSAVVGFLDCSTFVCNLWTAWVGQQFLLGEQMSRNPNISAVWGEHLCGSIGAVRPRLQKPRGILGSGSNISCCLTPAQRFWRACLCASTGTGTTNELAVSEQHQGKGDFYLCWKFAMLLWMSLHFWSVDSCLEQRLCSLSTQPGWWYPPHQKRLSAANWAARNNTSPYSWWWRRGNHDSKPPKLHPEALITAKTITRQGG